MSKISVFQMNEWWRHNGCWDREQASGITYNGDDDYLSVTDEWWFTLNDQQKEEVFNDYFDDL